MLMMARRVYVMWSSHSLRRSACSATDAGVSCDDVRATVIDIGAFPCAWAMFIPPETASAATALTKATSAVMPSGIRCVERVVFT